MKRMFQMILNKTKVVFTILKLLLNMSYEVRFEDEFLLGMLKPIFGFKGVFGPVSWGSIEGELWPKEFVDPMTKKHQFYVLSIP